MRLKSLSFLAATVLAAVSSYGATPAANHLILSEVGIIAKSGFNTFPTDAEYTEIYNPTGAPVSLDHYFISDYTLYFNLPSIVSAQASNTLNNGSDFMFQFPPGFTLAAGGAAIVVCNGANMRDNYFDKSLTNLTNLPNSPLIFETYDSDPSIPNMLNYNLSSAHYAIPRPPGDATVIADNGDNLSHTDAGEFTVLFYWDGVSSLVKDADIVEWLPAGDVWAGGDANQYSNKSNFGEQGPSASDQTYYAAELGTADNMDVHYNIVGHLERRSLLEAGQATSGSNGMTGEDETMEANNLTWVMVRGDPTNASPGITSLGLSSANQPPVVGPSSRDIQYPTPGQTVHISAPVYDDGTFTAKLMVDKGTGYVATTMTNGGSGDIYGADITGLTEGMHVKWYVMATDTANVSRTEADYQMQNSGFRGYHAFVAKTSPYSSSDILVSEIMYDPQGTDNYTHSQYVEIYNPASTPFNAGSLVFSTDYFIANPTNRLASTAVVPEGTIIPPHGYLVFAGNKTVFMNAYPGMDASRVIDCSQVPSLAVMAHAGSTLYFFGPNEYDFDSNPVPITAAFKSFTYDDVLPWPNSPAQGVGASNTGYSIELSPLTAVAEADPTKWQLSRVIDGTPNSDNSVDATLRPGDVGFVSANRDLEYPTPSQTITITAISSSSLPLVSAKVYVNSGSGFVATSMTTSTDNITFTAQIGPFADNKLVKYYVQGTDTAGHTGNFPYLAPQEIIPFKVESVPVTSGDIVINEIMFDPQGTDNSTMPEYIELYNRRSTPIDLSFYLYGTSLTANTRLMPEGTVIQGHGYLILACNKALFEDFYAAPFVNYVKYHTGLIDPNLVIDNGWQNSSFMANSGTPSVYLVHTNAVNWNGATTESIIHVVYQILAPWPTIGGAAVNGPSIELIDPSSDYTVGTSWSFPIYDHGTPGHRNSVTPPASAVSDWSLF